MEQNAIFFNTERIRIFLLELEMITYIINYMSVLQCLTEFRFFIFLLMLSSTRIATLLHQTSHDVILHDINKGQS